MRAWRAPELADILVSELLGTSSDLRSVIASSRTASSMVPLAEEPPLCHLLVQLQVFTHCPPAVVSLTGSFGDNELSPECLDGVQRFLKPGCGISIPESYTSFVSPVMSSKLWNEVKVRAHSMLAARPPAWTAISGLIRAVVTRPLVRATPLVQAYKELKWFETPYVVRMFDHVRLAAPQECFTFVHPNPQEPIDNRRYATLEFVSAVDGVVHGLGGYFDATLHGDVHISINPATHSPGMFSWFPLFIPLREPIAVRAGETVVVHIWRCVSAVKVWYEWAVATQSVHSPIHNPTGRSYWIGL